MHLLHPEKGGLLQFRPRQRSHAHENLSCNGTNESDYFSTSQSGNRNLRAFVGASACSERRGRRRGWYGTAGRCWAVVHGVKYGRPCLEFPRRP